MSAQEPACAGMNPNVFFIERGGNYDAKVDAAKAICAGCPVRESCLEHALKTKERDYGIFGGMTPEERKRIYRKRLRDARKAREAAA